MGLSERASRHEALRETPHIYIHRMNTASGTDQFTHTETDTKAEECRNVNV